MYARVYIESTKTNMETLNRPTESDQLSHIDPQDQDPLANVGFEGLDPRFSDVVYHFTPEENLEGIAREGMRHSDQYTDKWFKSDAKLMEVKPENIHVDLGRVVYGQLDQSNLGTRNGAGALKTDHERMESIAIAVDPSTTYVGDAVYREDHVPSMAGVREPSIGIGEPAEIQQSFWKNVMPLNVFRELYEPGYEPTWKLKDPTQADKLGIATRLYKPELYIPLEPGQDTIPTERLAHTASSLVGREPAMFPENFDRNIGAESEAEPQLSFNRSDLNKLMMRPDYSPVQILSLLEADFSEVMDKPAGVWEGYTIREHTAMVLGQVEKYVEGYDLPMGISPAAFHMMTALHDMGKPRAIEEGSKDLQHKYSREIVETVLTQLGFYDSEVAITAAVVDGDPIGAYLTGMLSAEESAQIITEKARQTVLTVPEFWSIQETFYKVDASSYTVDAGGKQSLDQLFEFHPEDGVLEFSASAERQISKLRNVLGIQ